MYSSIEESGGCRVWKKRENPPASAMGSCVQPSMTCLNPEEKGRSCIRKLEKIETAFYFYW